MKSLPKFKSRASIGGLTVLALAILTMTGCSMGNDVPLVPDLTLKIADPTQTGFVVTWKPASNDPWFSDYRYDVYVGGATVETLSDLDGLEPVATGSATEFGGSPLSYEVTGLSPGLIYFVTVAVSTADGSATTLYTGLEVQTVGSTTAAAAVTESGSYQLVPLDNDSLGGTYAIDVNVGMGTRDLYLVFANPAGGPTDAPTIYKSSQVNPDASSRSLDSSTTTSEPAGPIILRDRPDILAMENELEPSRSVSRSLDGPSYAITDSPRAEQVFYDYTSSSGRIEIPATNRWVETVSTAVGDKTLSIWVEDDSWTGAGVKTYEIDQSMVDNLAANFLTAGDANDIYDWMTPVFGEEWGSHGGYPLIPDEDHITILLYDIEGDDSPNGGIVGYFWAKDNYYRDSASSGSITASNERVMFYMDSVMYANPDDEATGWDPGDFWPKEIVSTLAHEFQHMITFYQRNVLRDATTPTWLNEMLSMMAEDLVARKLEVDGPRGVLYSDPSAGSERNDTGRFPDYNSLPDGSLIGWDSSSVTRVLQDYGLSYSFGAFLSRNYGGAALARALVQNDRSTSNEILSAGVSSAGGPSGTDLSDLLWRWGVSVLLSDNSTSVDQPVRLNKGAAWESSSVAGTAITYDLGSINAFNYMRGGGPAEGPLIYTDLDGVNGMSGGSKLLYRYGTGLTGTVTVTVNLPAGVQLALVAK